MSIENTLERIATALEAIAAGQAPTVEGTPEKPKRAPSAPKPSAKDTSSTVDTKEETPSGEAKDDQAAASDTAGDQSALTYEGDVKPLVLKVGATKGRPAALALLAEFEVAKADQIDAAEWPRFIARAEELLS